MYKLSPDLSKNFDIFCNVVRKKMIFTTLRTAPKPLVPAGLLLAHHERKLTTADDLIVCDVVALQGLAIELHALNIAALLAIALADNAEHTTSNIDLCLVNKWHTEYIAASSWLNRVEAESCHNIPSRHLTYVLVT